MLHKIIAIISASDTFPPRASALPAIAARSPWPSLVGIPISQAMPDQIKTARSDAITAPSPLPDGKSAIRAEFSATAGKKREKLTIPINPHTAERKAARRLVKALQDTAPVTLFAQSVAPSINKARAKEIKDSIIFTFIAC